MDFLTIAIIGAYGAYPTLAAVYIKLRDQLDRLVTNHLKHLEARVTRLEERQPPM